MNSKSILEVEESVQLALEALPSVLRSNPLTPLTQQLSEAFKVLAPPGYRPVVELQENGRKKRRTASAENWTPDTGEILISFSRDSSSQQPQKPAPVPPPGPFVGPRTRQLLDLRERNVRASEQRPQSAKNQSDYGSAPARPALSTHHSQMPLNSPGPSPVSSDAREMELCQALEEVERQGRAFISLKWFRDDVLPAKGFAWASDPEQRQAILAEAIAKRLILTSRVPNPRSPFPTTALRLNRAPASPQSEGRRYSPVRIQGEQLSSTILRDRGVY
jgi:hypothetical protein